MQARDDLAQEAKALLAPHAQRRVFAPGDLLWREGDDAGMLVAIESGRVKIYRVLPNGNAVTLYLFGPHAGHDQEHGTDHPEEGRLPLVIRLDRIALPDLQGRPYEITELRAILAPVVIGARR